ncbi:hypothetical protein BDV29DRAFT_171494 [Aspergillus leporis]|uniref:Uncharacterized protein n=1 Tax=Aspergillus leporis TaxID=41062 RepID=A0A5N5X6B5_9EURO|nr:hypothetical protein BDV29DRAFT_171494 [Aspergillus leporis]
MMACKRRSVPDPGVLLYKRIGVQYRGTGYRRKGGTCSNSMLMGIILVLKIGTLLKYDA